MEPPPQGIVRSVSFRSGDRSPVARARLMQPPVCSNNVPWTVKFHLNKNNMSYFDIRKQIFSICQMGQTQSQSSFACAKIAMAAPHNEKAAGKSRRLRNECERSVCQPALRIGWWPPCWPLPDSLVLKLRIRFRRSPVSLARTSADAVVSSAMAAFCCVA